jgi:hypothetical protein
VPRSEERDAALLISSAAIMVEDSIGNDRAVGGTRISWSWCYCYSVRVRACVVPGCR